MSLPINRSAKATLDANLVNGTTSDAPTLKASDDILYNTIDELYNFVLNLVNAGSLTTYPPGQYNKLINGNFDVWQRGTNQITTANGAYFPDRISIASFANNASAIKIDRGSASPPIGSKYYLRYRLSTASAALVSVSRFFRYKMESIDVHKLVGNQVTVSFKIKSSVARNFLYSINVYGFTGADNGVNGTGLISGEGDYAGNTLALAADTWTTVSKTFTMQDPISGTGLATNGISIELWGRYTTLGAETDTEYQFSQIQLVVGAIALPYQPRSFPEELALCQRYFEKSGNYTDAVGAGTLVGVAAWQIANNKVSSEMLYRVRKRAAPTVTLYDNASVSGKALWILHGGSSVSLTSVAGVNSEIGFTAGSTSTDSLAINNVAFAFASDAEL